MLAAAFMMTEDSQSVADPTPAQIQAPASPVTVPRQAPGGKCLIKGKGGCLVKVFNGTGVGGGDH